MRNANLGAGPSRVRVVAWLLCLAWAARAWGAGPVLRCFPAGPIYQYRWQLLSLALAHTSGGADFRVEPATAEITQKRSLRQLQAGALDVLALGSNPEREAAGLPIRIDILKGIIGYRVFLIRRSDQARLDRMDDATLRREVSFGLQRDWADLPIMEAAGFAVETTSDSENLYRMLAAGRFDAFPRGLNEANRDLAAHQPANPQLALEAHRALYFPYPVYFWVRAGDLELARRIELGLRRAEADGSWRRLFLAAFAREIAQLDRQRRHVLLLSNPFLPTAGAEPDTRWWWRPSSQPITAPGAP